MVTFLIVLVIVGTLIVLGTRLSLYLYRSGALENSHVRHQRPLRPIPVGAVSEEVPADNAYSGDIFETYDRKARLVRIGLLLLVLVLVIGILAIVMIFLLSAIFS